MSFYKKYYSPYWLMGFGILLVGFVIFLMAVTFGLLPNPVLKFFPQPNLASQTTVSPSSAVDNISTSSALESRKKDIKIQILNASGISGQAAKLRNLLKNIGFANIEIGNFNGEDQKDTTIIYSAQVPKVIQNEITKEIGRNLTNVTTSKATDSANLKFDVLITVGR